MKTIILAAGVGSRIRPLTDNCPKSLLNVGGRTILDMMLSHINACGMNEVVFVLGYLQNKIEDYVNEKFPDLDAVFLSNDRYAETNTGYSLMLAMDVIQGSAFVKFDADVVFDQKILNSLMASKHENCLCMDRNIDLDAEEIKVVIEDQNRVIKASKSVDPSVAAGESIGIEKIGSETATYLLSELRRMMANGDNHQEYYESAYERLIERHVPFHALDISGLSWTEIDTKDDLDKAQSIFHPKTLGELYVPTSGLGSPLETTV